MFSVYENICTTKINGKSFKSECIMYLLAELHTTEVGASPRMPIPQLLKLTTTK